MLHLDITHEERWESSKLVQKWILQGRCQSPPPPDVNSLAGARDRARVGHVEQQRAQRVALKRAQRRDAGLGQAGREDAREARAAAVATIATIASVRG